MSVASYEGPASRKEVGDQRFLETVAVLGVTAAKFEVETTPATAQPEPDTGNAQHSDAA